VNSEIHDVLTLEATLQYSSRLQATAISTGSTKTGTAERSCVFAAERDLLCFSPGKLIVLLGNGVEKPLPRRRITPQGASAKSELIDGDRRIDGYSETRDRKYQIYIPGDARIEGFCAFNELKERLERLEKMLTQVQELIETAR